MKPLQFPPEIGTPGIDFRPARHAVGLRIITPFEGMFAQIDKLFKELRQWVNAHDLADQGPYFLRYHVIDMNGLMDVEAGFVVTTPQTGDERVSRGCGNDSRLKQPYDISDNSCYPSNGNCAGSDAHSSSLTNSRF